jgi:GntR family histidine utilization transcriptional repressor
MRPRLTCSRRTGAWPRHSHTAACLQVKCWTWRQGQGITFVVQLFPGGAYDLVARFGAERR